MFLKSLEICGFKSFARLTRLEFPPGITALVGPNGSGKSNVVDAVRWSLGEQSMRDLRGQRAEDVIYAVPRRSLGAAEVALTFEESSALDGAPWSELCVARRLYRSGESEYLINRQKARLKDVVSALGTAGIDAGHHVIVNQGTADALLSCTPLERRALLEQAAGLTAYRDHRDEARQKLATIAQHIETSEMVLAELEPRVRLLRRQARAVEEREDAARRLRVRLIDWYGARWSGLKERMRSAVQEAHALGRQRGSISAEVERLEAEAESALQRERAWQRELESASGAAHAVEREHLAVGRELEHLERRLVALREGQADGSDAALRPRDTVGEAEHRYRAIEQMLQALQTQRQEQEAERSQLLTRADDLQQEREKRRQPVERERAAREIADRREAQLCQLIDRLRSRRESDTERCQCAAAAEEDCEVELEGVQREVRALQVRLAKAQRDEAQRGADLRRLETQRERERNAVVRLDRVERRARSARSETSARLAAAASSLGRLKRELGSGLISSLEVAPGWEVAVSSALGGWARATGGLGAGAILHRADVDGFLGWRGAVERYLRGPVQWADRLVSGFPADLVNPLSATLLVEEDGEAQTTWQRLKRIPAYTVGSPPLQIVTRQGSRWSAVGMRRASGEDRTAVYLRASRLAVELRGQLEVRERRVAALHAARQARNAALVELESAVQVAETAFQGVRSHHRNLADRSAQLERRCAGLRADRERYGAEGREMRARLDLASRELKRLEGERRGAEQDAIRAAGALRAAETSAEATDAELSRVRELCMAAANRIEILCAREAAHTELAAAARREVQRLTDDKLRMAAEQERLAGEIQLLGAEIEVRRRRREELETRLRTQSQGVRMLREHRPSSVDQTVLRERRSRLSELVSRHERSLADLAQLTEACDRVRAEVRSELGVEPGDLPPDIPNVPGEDELRRLRARAAQYADADPAVIEECLQLTERQKSLQRHIDDLKSASANLNDIMEAADREMRARYRRAFEAVSEEFSRVFQIMLRGGKVELEQIDDQGGVEVRAQLPGRRARSSAAFSGGERALVASALLFGVLRIRPAPFCILDEVDAALDETNVDRYLSVLRDLSQRTQTIVVTHNRATMAAADVLYGLTMDDEGVSRLLSLRLDAYEAAV